MVVATHLNTDHFHNHFVVCSTSFLDAKRYNYNGKERKRMMQISDRLCREHSLFVVESPQANRAVSYAEWHAQQEGQPTKRSLVRADIDAALTECFTPKQFSQAMARMGYVLNFSRKYPTLKPVNGTRAFRFDSLGAGYTVEDIKARIMGNYRAPEAAPKQAAKRPTQPIFKQYKYKGAWKPNSHNQGVRGLRALYYHYCHLLGVSPHKQQNHKRMYALLHDDIIRMDKTIQASRLLFAHQIDTQEQLFSFAKQNARDQTELTATRQHLRRILRTESVPEKQDALKRQIGAVSERLKTLRAEQKLCEDVAARSGIVAENFRQTRQAQTAEHGKEKGHESRRRRR